MNKRIAIVFLAAAVLLGTACTDRGYVVEPVVGPNDPREVGDIPELGDTKARQEQDCFMVQIYAGGWTTDYQDEGIACMVPTTEEAPK